MRIFRLLLLFPTVACGGDDGGGLPVDGPPIDRADPIDSVDAPPDCGVSSTDFGDLGEITAGVATMQGGNGGGLAEIIIPVTAGTLADRVVLDLWGMTEHNPDPIMAGTYELTGIQTAFQTCTVCVSLGAKWPEGGAPDFDYVYLATGGTANVTSIDPNPGGAVEFELTDVTLQRAGLWDYFSGLANLHAEAVQIIRYEDLCANPRTVLQFVHRRFFPERDFDASRIELRSREPEPMDALTAWDKECLRAICSNNAGAFGYCLYD